MKTILFRGWTEFDSTHNKKAVIPLIRTIILGIAFTLSTAQILHAQDEFPKQVGLHAQQGIDLIPEPQIVADTGGDFVNNSTTVVYADSRLQDFFPVISLQEGLTEALNNQFKKADSQAAKNSIY